MSDGTDTRRSALCSNETFEPEKRCVAGDAGTAARAIRRAGAVVEAIEDLILIPVNAHAHACARRNRCIGERLSIACRVCFRAKSRFQNRRTAVVRGVQGTVRARVTLFDTAFDCLHDDVALRHHAAENLRRKGLARLGIDEAYAVVDVGDRECRRRDRDLLADDRRDIGGRNEHERLEIEPVLR